MHARCHLSALVLLMSDAPRHRTGMGHRTGYIRRLSAGAAGASCGMARARAAVSDLLMWGPDPRGIAMGLLRRNARRSGRIGRRAPPRTDREAVARWERSTWRMRLMRWCPIGSALARHRPRSAGRAAPPPLVSAAWMHHLSTSAHPSSSIRGLGHLWEHFGAMAVRLRGAVRTPCWCQIGRMMLTIHVLIAV